MNAFAEANPAFSDEEMIALAGRYFGLSGTIRQLPSERDQNARLTADGADYVIKIANPAEDPARIAMQAAVMNHLATVGMNGMPRVVPAKDGADHVMVSVGDRPALMRVVTWVAGTPLAQSPRSMGQMTALGAYMGQLTQAMQGFGHAAAFRADFPWSLDHVGQLRGHVADIVDPARRAMVTDLFDRYATEIAPRLPFLRASVLHQDANDCNVITDPGDPARIAGLIDFGDMCHGRTVNELAITLAYALLDATDIAADMQAIIAGFVSRFPLTEAEAGLVFDLMRMRLVCSVCISSRQSKLHPENEYLLVSQQPAFALLERLEAMPRGRMVGLCRSAAGYGSEPVLAALEKLPVASILPGDLTRHARMALSGDAPRLADPGFEDWFAGQRPNLPDNLPFLGIERDADEVRIVVPAGLPVSAPLGGRVKATAPVLTLRHEAAGRTVLSLFARVVPAVAVGATVKAGEVIGHVGARTQNGGLAPHVAFGLVEEEGAALDPNVILRLEPESYAVDADPPAALLARRQRAIGRSLSLSYREKLKIIRGRGSWLIDHTGRRYLDTVNNITHVGHCHPHVVQAMARQAAELNTNSRYLHPLMPALADRIAATLPGDLSVVTFVNSGTEANELALRIARTALGKKDTVVLDWAYHGNSGGMVEISPYKFKRGGGFPQPDFVQVAIFPDPYRGRFRGADSGPAYAADIDRCLDAVATRTGDGAATFIAESVSGVGGQVVLPQGYLAAVYDRVRAKGGICIADEVQCGFGRVGQAFWGFELQGVVPDIVVLGKPIGNGHPLAAVVTTPALAARFANGMEYFNSFGGNPVSMAVGHAVMDVIEGEGLQARAIDTGAMLMEGFRDLASRHDIIGDVRGSGLFIGVELVRDRDRGDPAGAAADHVVDQLRQRGVLSATDGPDDNVLKIKPPMVFGPAEAEILLAETEAALKTIPGTAR